jgi:hypothetical protein
MTTNLDPDELDRIHGKLRIAIVQARGHVRELDGVIDFLRELDPDTTIRIGALLKLIAWPELRAIGAVSDAYVCVRDELGPAIGRPRLTLDDLDETELTP